VTALPTSECKLCGKPVVWAEGKLATGAPAKLPLDAKAPCYVVTRKFMSSIGCERASEAMVLHHAVCEGLRKRPPADDEQLDEEFTALRAEVQKYHDELIGERERLARFLDNHAAAAARNFDGIATGLPHLKPHEVHAALLIQMAKVVRAAT